MRGPDLDRQRHRLRNLPLNGLVANQPWCATVMLAADLIAWTQVIGFDPAHEASLWEPKNFACARSPSRLLSPGTVAGSCYTSSTPPPTLTRELNAWKRLHNAVQYLQRPRRAEYQAIIPRSLHHHRTCGTKDLTRQPHERSTLGSPGVPSGLSPLSIPKQDG